MAITNLSEYYASQGQALPTVQDRQSTASQAGIQGYTGTAQQNVTLLGYLQGGGNQAQGTTGIPSSGAVTIPSQVATGNVQPTQLPSQPTPSAPGDVYSSASAYLSSLPKTGVAGLDQTLTAWESRPGELAKQYDILNKQQKYNALTNELNTFNEDYRQKYELIRTDASQSAGQKQDEITALDKTRAYRAGTMALQAAFAQQDYQGALSLMNQQSALELEPLKMRYDFFKDRYNRTEDFRFKKMAMDYQNEYDQKKAQAELDNQLKASTMGLMTPEKAALFVKDQTAQKASARAGVIKAVEDYNALVQKYKGADTFSLTGEADWSHLTNKEKAELDAALNTTVGSAINVAQGQGAMGDQEAQRILGGLQVSRWKRGSVVNSAAQGIINAQKSLLGGDLGLLEISYPGVRSLSMFSPYMSDVEFFNAGSSTSSTPSTNYFMSI